MIQYIEYLVERKRHQMTDKMTWILLMLLTSTYKGVSGYEVLNKKSTWKESNVSCTLATPALNITRDGMFVQINSSGITEREEYWIGYKHVSQLFEYIGCARETDATKLSIKNITLSSSLNHGACYWACNTSIIGLKVQSCYCFKTRPEVEDTLTNCNKTASRIPVGGASSVSLFNISTIPLNHTLYKNMYADSGKKCVAFRQKDGSLVLERCTNRMYAICKTKNMNNKSEPIKNEYPSSKSGNYSWSESCDYCFSRGQYPVQETKYMYGPAVQNISREHNITKNNGVSDDHLWTGMFMSKTVIRKCGEPGRAVSYGYMYHSNGTMELFFASRTTSKKHPALCAETTTAKTTTIDKSTAVTVVTTANKTTPNGDSTTTIVVTTAAVPVNQNKLSNDEDQSNDTGLVLLAIFVPLAVAGIAVTVVAVICYRKRAKRKTARQSPALYRDYNEVRDAYEDTEYVFAVPLDTIESTQRQPSNPNDEGAYDVSGASGLEKDVGNHTESGTIYNKLNTQSGDTYDHTKLTNAARTGKSMKTFKSNVDVIYSTSQTRDESYDTTIPKQRGPVLTDNVYSHANNDETS